MEDGPAVATAERTIQDETKKLPTRYLRDTITCRSFNGVDHFVKDYVRPHVERQKPSIRYYRRTK